jgi:hypothetical protein
MLLRMLLDTIHNIYTIFTYLHDIDLYTSCWFTSNMHHLLYTVYIIDLHHIYTSYIRTSYIYIDICVYQTILTSYRFASCIYIYHKIITSYIFKSYIYIYHTIITTYRFASYIYIIQYLHNIYLHHIYVIQYLHHIDMHHIYI